jgi:SAM-dependent methyltransferase
MLQFGMSFFTRSLRHLRNPVSLPSLLWKNLVFPFSPQGAEARWDRKWNVETRGWLNPDELGAKDPSNTEGYLATPVGIFNFLVERASTHLGDLGAATFIDFGCGKGRTLLLAAQHGFGRVVGVEFSSNLCHIATANAHRFAASFGRPLTPIEIVCGDARDYMIPPTACLFWFFHPFDIAVMNIVAERIAQSLAAKPRPIAIVYYHPRAAAAFERPEFAMIPVPDLPHDPMDWCRGQLKAVIYEPSPSFLHGCVQSTEAHST